MMAPRYTSLRCSDCDVNWPHTTLYADCPTCGKSTWLDPGTQAIDHGDAASRITEHKKREESYAAFEVYYANREAEALRRELDAAQFASLG